MPKSAMHHRSASLTVFTKNTAGQALVEFAFIMPLLILMFFGMIEIALALNTKQVIIAAAREGARAGALTNSNEEIRSAVWNTVETIDKRDENGEAMKTEILIIPEYESDLLRSRGGMLTVKVTYPLKMRIPFINLETDLSAETTVRIEHDQ